MVDLKKVKSVTELRKLPEEELPELAQQIREEIIDTVSRNGGHLGASLGAVELIIALHYVFDTPADKLVFDVGHQAYAHKILTGRREAFHSLRRFGGCAGFPNPAESEFDTTVCGHAGTAVSAALGMARACEDHKVIALVGDGSLNCGISLEGLNNANSCGKNLIVILNDNKMSISHNVGSIPHYLNQLIAGCYYNRCKMAVKRMLRKVPRHEMLYRMIRRCEDVLKGFFLPGSFFEQLGFRYIGPLDGHDLPHLVKTLTKVRSLEGPIFLHVITEKGHGCEFARSNPAKYHGVPGFDRESGEIPKSQGDSFSAAFGRAMVKLGQDHEDVVAITAAMGRGTGLQPFAAAYPRRYFDVGIAEEHAVTFAAGLAVGGLRPVCAIYATFMQRALDCIYHDVVLAGLPVIFAIDRSGVVEDGPTHHGIYDLGFLRSLPGLVIMAPRSEEELEVMLAEAYRLAAPVAIRYPRGGSREQSAISPTPLMTGHAEILRSGNGPVLWAMGPECSTALKVAEILEAHQIDCTVVNARYLAPFDASLARKLAADQRLCASIEDHRTTGGLASALDEALADTAHGAIVHFGWPDQVIPHGGVAKLRENFGLTAPAIAEALLKRLVLDQ